MNPLVFAILMASAPPAPAPDPGCTIEASPLTKLFAGVRTQSVTVTCPSSSGPTHTRVHVVRVHVTAPGIAFETSGGAKDRLKLELPTAFLQRTGSQVAFNANLFTNCCSYTPPKPATTGLCGLEISGGAILSEWNNKPAACHGFPFPRSLVVTGGKLAILPSDKVPADAAAAVTGSHDLVAANINVAPPDIEGDEFFGPNARTVVGLSAGTAVLWVAAVTRETSRGLTLRQAAQMLQELGASNAINLDGGGSTSLAVDSGNGRAKLLNIPSDTYSPCTFPAGTGCERYVGASFAIHARPLAQAPHPVRP